MISRIQASVNGKKQELQQSIRRDLAEGILALLQRREENLDQVKKVAVSANATMGHLLMGYDCDTLGVYPFTPVNTGFIRGTMEEIIGIKSRAQVVLLPGISTYVGGDIVSGLYACGFGRSDEICLLIDLGTNGEMALGNRKKILATSTAAGPAFEGGNILWGTGSIPGAICSVEIENTETKIQTIGGKTPAGICGTGVVEMVAALVKQELVDVTGLLDKSYFDGGFPLAKNGKGKMIVFTQKDIREIQLAKVAVRAGMETLFFKYGVSREQVSKVYLAGGFGYRLDAKKAVAIGMLPGELEDRIQPVGNSSLAGAALYLQEKSSEKAMRDLLGVSEETQLMSGGKFNAYYMDAMMFAGE